MKKAIFSLLLLGSAYALFAQDVRTGDSSYNRNNNSNNSTNNMNNPSTTDNSLSNTSSYSAYSSVPVNVRTSFQRDYPSASNVNWQQSNEWWHVTYMNNGQAMHTYYNTAGLTYNVALPVIQTQVPADIISKVGTMYGPTVYDITRVKGMDNQDEYLVRILDNGQIRTERINGDGMTVNETNNGSLNSTSTMDNTSNSTDNTSVNNNNTTDNNSTSVNTTTTTTETTTTDNGDMNSATSNKAKDKMKIKTTTDDGKKHIMKMKNGKVRNKTINNNQYPDQNQ